MATEFAPDSFGPIEPDERAALLARLADLASRIFLTGLDRNALEIDLEMLGYAFPISPPPIPWTAVKKRLEDRAQITKAPLAALLATDWPPLTLNGENFEAAIALISGISISLEAKRVRDGQSYQPAISRACHALRKLADRPDDFADFPDFRQELLPIRKSLTAQRSGADKTLRNYISALGALIRYRYGNRDAITRVVGKAPQEAAGIAFRDTGLVDENGEGLKHLFATGKDRTLIPEAGQHNDGASILLFGDFSSAATPHSSPEAKSLNRLARRRWLTHAAIRAQYLPCDYRRITDAEAQYCWRKIDIGLSAGESKTAWKGLLFCGLMLMTGRSLDRLLSTPVSEKAAGAEYILLHKNGGAELVFHPTYPTNEMTDEAMEHLVKSSGYTRSVRYMLPPPLGLALHRLAQKTNESLFEGDDRREQTKAILQEFGKSLERPLPAGRVSSFLPASLKDEGFDNAIISLIVGEQPARYPGLYYAAIDLAQINAAYEDTLSKRLEITSPFNNASASRTAQEKSSSAIIGTRIRPIEKKIKAAFRLQRSVLSKRRRDSLEQRLAFHNVYTLYCYQLLALATGHRPVTAPFERITDFDLDAGFVWISDKESRNGAAARLAPLPPSATKQVEFYKSHLLALAQKRFGGRKQIGDAVAQALSGEGPFLFFVDGRQPKPLRPLELTARLATVWPLPLNWHRHYLRTVFSTPLRSELLDAMMGHADFDQEPLSSVSGLSVRDLKIIGHEIEKAMSDLSAAPLEGLTQ